MTTCQDCGKFNPGKTEFGNHWICGDCKEDPQAKQNKTKKEDE